VSGSVTEAYVYDARGQLAAEYGGAAVETATHYVTADHLGSTRVITDASKGVLQCKDYLPFGDEILATTQNARSGIGCYSGETGLRQKFTGKERDSESRLDYFGARYFSWAAGRFTSPDAKMFPNKTDDPQSWNKFAYSRNNPLRYVDPNGEDWEDVLKGTVNALASNNQLGLGRLESRNSDFQVGQAIGDALSTIQGTVEVLAGGGTSGGGFALSTTGVGAFVGVPTSAAGLALIGHGSTTAGSGFVHLAKSVPNPFGAKGAPDHQQTAAEEAAKIRGDTEVTVKTPGGEKGSRRIDAARVKNGRVTEAVQVFRPNKSGNPPAREQRAAKDIENATGSKPRMVPVRRPKEELD
jgi:RHS repeat-associated protein